MRELLARLKGAGLTLCADGYAAAEARRNLDEKGAGALEALGVLLTQVEMAPVQTSALPPDAAAMLPEKNRPAVAAAIHRGCDALVTGDRTHFGTLYGKVMRGVKIHSPRSLAEELLK